MKKTGYRIGKEVVVSAEEIFEATIRLAGCRARGVDNRTGSLALYAAQSIERLTFDDLRRELERSVKR